MRSVVALVCVWGLLFIATVAVFASHQDWERLFLVLLAWCGGIVSALLIQEFRRSR